MFLTKKPSGLYYIIYNNTEGKRTSKSTGETRKAEATKKLLKYSREIEFIEENGVLPITLKRFYWEFLKYSESVHTPKTTKTHLTTRKYILEYFDNEIQLKDLTTKDIYEYLLERKKKTSIYAARKDHINFSSALTKAVLDGFLLENPCKGIKRFKLPEKQPTFYSKSDLETLLSIIPSEDIKHITEFAFNTGLRLGELTNLTWNQINFPNEILTLDNRETITKSKKVRSIPLNQTALRILNQRILLNEKFVFTINNERIKDSRFSKNFKKYVTRAKLNPRLNFHSLRHSFASILIQKGVSIFHVSKLLGHADIKTTMIYSHVQTEDLRNATDLL